MLRPETRRWLLFVARRALREAFVEHYGNAYPLPLNPPPRPHDPIFERPARTFVTWRHGRELVGCIGTVSPHEPLEAAVARYSALAAMDDPRTPTPTPDQWDGLHCSISVLTEPRDIAAVGLRSIAESIEPGRDGVTLAFGHKRALLLPAVWEMLPDRYEFILALAQKAGINPHTEGDAATAQVFEAQKFEELEPIEVPL